jgi:hypothetical protein
MTNSINLINNLKALSLNLIRIHKICMDGQFRELEVKSGPLNPNQKLQLLLHAPEFEWLRPLSQLTSLVDGVIFQKDKIQEYKITEIKTEVNRLFISQSNKEFAETFNKVKPLSKDIQTLVDGVLEQNKNLL